MKTTEEQIEDTNTPQKVWHNIVEACQTYGKEQRGIKKRTKKSNNKQVQDLSTEQKKACDWKYQSARAKPKEENYK